jgi:hypothetical protein
MLGQSRDRPNKPSIVNNYAKLSMSNMCQEPFLPVLLGPSGQTALENDVTPSSSSPHLAHFFPCKTFYADLPDANNLAAAASMLDSRIHANDERRCWS